MVQYWAVVCLGFNEPKIYGPYYSEMEADENVEAHCPPSDANPLGLCPNGISADDHHVLQMEA